jgi:hypothetical protein
MVIGGAGMSGGGIHIIILPMLGTGAIIIGIMCTAIEQSGERRPV